MPLKLSVGQSRKVSENYNSRGFSLQIEAELPANAIDDATTVAETANHLFQLCDDLLEDQVRQASPEQTGNGNGKHQPVRSARPAEARADRKNGHSVPASNNNHSGNGSNGNGRPITGAQSKAIINMANRLDQDVDALVEERFGAGGLAELTVSEASQLIDQLKQRIERQQKNGAAR